MDFRDLQFFIAVADELHFARAAERLGIVPAAVSQRIRDLEGELGVALFERTSRTVRLTPSGAELVAPARAALAALDDIRSLAGALADGTAGRIVLGIAPNAGTFAAWLIAAVTDAHPDVQVVGTSIWGRDALDALRAGEVEAALVRGAVASPGIGSRLVGSYEDSYVAVPATDADAGRATLSPVDFEDRPLLVIERAMAPAIHDATVAFFSRHGVTPRWRTHRMQDYEQQMVLVAAGVGASLVHSHQAAVAYRDIAIVPLDVPGPRYDINLVWVAHRSSPVLDTLRHLPGPFASGE